jgi:mannose-6-phosphate isomerase-like protein (cupin superfamily)
MSATGEVHQLLSVLERLQDGGQPYYEFIRHDALSAGIYHLTAGEPDRQRPHSEDEVYYVIGGEGRVEIDGELTDVRPGSVIYVRKHVLHRFVDYPEGLTLLVIFAPARGSSAERE